MRTSFVLLTKLLSLFGVASCVPAYSNSEGVVCVPLSPGCGKLHINIVNGIKSKPKPYQANQARPTPPKTTNKPTSGAGGNPTSGAHGSPVPILGTTLKPSQTAAPVAGVPPGPAASLEKLREALLAETNQFRKVHNAVPLTTAESLDKAAQGFANELALLKKMAHSAPQSRPGQGENLAEKCSMVDNRMTAKEAIGAFYDEIKLYNFDKPNPSPDNGHLTQLLWKGSKKTGSGEVKFVNDKGETCYLIVIRYVPAGNVKDGYLRNVEKGTYKGTDFAVRQLEYETDAKIRTM